MKIYHKYKDTYHEIVFNRSKITYEDDERTEEKPGTRKSSGQYDPPLYIETADYKSIPIIKSYVICPICSKKVLICEKDK